MFFASSGKSGLVEFSAISLFKTYLFGFDYAKKRDLYAKDNTKKIFKIDILAH